MKVVAIDGNGNKVVEGECDGKLYDSFYYRIVTDSGEATLYLGSFCYKAEDFVEISTMLRLHAKERKEMDQRQIAEVYDFRRDHLLFPEG